MVPILHVCTTCRAGTLPEPPLPVPGAMLHERLLERVAGEATIVGVECLSICDHGCAAAISMPGKWSYLLGRLRPELATDLLDFATRYAAARTGTVMPSRRAPSLANMIMGRIPSILEPAA